MIFDTSFWARVLSESI